jgi:hypothetical protein
MQFDSFATNHGGECNRTGKLNRLWWVGYFKNEVGRGILTPTHPTLPQKFLYSDKKGGPPYPASVSQFTVGEIEGTLKK